MSILQGRFPSSLTRFVIAAACVAVVGISQAQVKQGKTRALKTSQLMKVVVKPSCDALKKGLDPAPATPEAWDSLASHAAVLNEVSYLLMDDGRCPDGVWAEASTKALREGSASLLKAIDAKDAAAAKAAFGATTKSCGACHEKHKPK